MMDLKINIINDAHCKVIIEDKTEYLPENNFGFSANREYRYSDTSSIIVLLHNKIDDTVVKTPIFNDHSSNNYTEIPIQFDGWFTVNYLVLPNRKWINAHKNSLNVIPYVYFVDNNSIYKYSNGEEYLVSVEELLEINTNVSTILKYSKDYISICFLQKCYINLCLLIFNSRGLTSCWNKNNVDSELVFKRDLTWMAINVIKYLTEFNLLAEVERILEIISSCNGLCKFNTTYLPTNSGCGCSK